VEWKLQTNIFTNSANLKATGKLLEPNNYTADFQMFVLQALKPRMPSKKHFV
jgi:hypothetical protein